MSKVASTGAIRALEVAIDRARSERCVGVTIITYFDDGGWHTSNAGSILRTPVIGIAAAHVLAAQFAKRVEEDIFIDSHTERRA